MRKPHSSTSLLLKPLSSLPNTTATLLFLAIANIFFMASFIGSIMPLRFLILLVVPTTKLFYLIAIPKFEYIFVSPSISTALHAICLASSVKNLQGFTSSRSLKPHILQRPRRGTYIAWLSQIDEHERNIFFL